MPTYLLAFLLMLAAFLLITLAAVARDLWRRLRPIGSSHAAFERPPLKSSVSDLLLLLGVAMAWYNVSSGWIAQLTIYPMYADMSTYGPEAFHAFGRGYLSRLPIIVLPAGVMCLAWPLWESHPCRQVSNIRCPSKASRMLCRCAFSGRTEFVQSSSPSLVY